MQHDGRRRPITAMEIYDRLGDIAIRLGWLKPSSSRPEQYHEEKSELLRDLGRLREHVRVGMVSDGAQRDARSRA